MNVHPFSYIYF